MSDPLSKLCTAFDGHRLLLSGPLVEVALAVKTAAENGSPTTILVFDDETGRVIDLDLRGTRTDIIERLCRPPKASAGRFRPGSGEDSESAKDEVSESRGRGRPKLGVVSREVTLLPGQWDWLAAQSGGASAVLRRLIEAERRNRGSKLKRRAAQEAAYHFMLAIAGDLPGYEEATRALFADDRPGLEQRIADWPQEIRAYVVQLAFGAPAQPLAK